MVGTSLCRRSSSQINPLAFQATKNCGRQLAICSRNLAYTTAGDMAATRVEDGVMDQPVNKQTDNP